MCTAAVGGSIHRAARRVTAASDQASTTPMTSNCTKDRRKPLRSGTLGRISGFWVRPNQLVRKGGLEPPWVSPPDPKSGASANSATFALRASTWFYGLYRRLGAIHSIIVLVTMPETMPDFNFA